MSNHKIYIEINIWNNGCGDCGGSYKQLGKIYIYFFHGGSFLPWDEMSGWQLELGGTCYGRLSKYKPKCPDNLHGSINYRNVNIRGRGADTPLIKLLQVERRQGGNMSVCFLCYLFIAHI